MELYVHREQHIKPYLGISKTDTSQDAVLDILNNAATGLLNGVLNVTTLAFHTVTDERFDGGVSEIWCRDFPVLSVSSIKQGRYETLYTQSDAYIFEKNRVLLDGYVDGGKGYDQSKISYTAGYITYNQQEERDRDDVDENAKRENMPEDLKLATLILIAGMFNQRNNQGVSTISIQGKSVSFRNEIEVREFEKIVNRYKKMLQTAI